MRSNQILHTAELTHILRLKMGKLSREVVWIHIAVCGDQHLLAAALFYKREIAAPLILDPDCVEILWLCAENDHDFGAVKRGEDIWLIGRAELVLKGYAGEEDLESFLCKLMIEVVCKDAVLRAPTVRIGLLVADEYVEGFFLLGYGEDALLDLVDRVRFCFVD